MLTPTSSIVSEVTLLVANRGEIALRIIRSATELGLDTVAVYAEDDADCPHVHAATRAVALRGVGPAAYLDQHTVLAAAGGCTLVHPGYGFLAENAEFAAACADAGLIFVGPSPQLLRRFGDKSSAREAAIVAQVPVLAATDGASTLEQVRQFLATQPGGVMLKALAGGGGRGMRPVRAESELDDAYRSCTAEAQLGFGRPDLFAEALCERARHIEVQIVAAPGVDGQAVALALGDRDCSVQRRHQKLVEVAPAQHLDAALRRQLHEAAARLCACVGYRGLATVEFLVTNEQFVFLEVNPRIQVEHTITEEVTGVDLVAVQLAIAQDVAFPDLDLPEGVTAMGTTTSGRPAKARGIAIQARVNMETLQADGQVLPAAGTLATFAPPTGPGVRVDTYGRPGLTPSPRYDSLLAKVITHTAGDFAAAARKAETALDEFVIDGIETSLPLLRSILADTDFRAATVDTVWLGERLGDLATTAQSQPLGSDDDTVRAQLGGIVIEVAAPGSEVAAGAQLAVLEAMKMQHVVLAPADVEIRRTLVAAGQTVGAGVPLMLVKHIGRGIAAQASTVDLDRERLDLAEIRGRHDVTLDAARPGAVEKRRKLARRTARENITDLVDEGSFVEYGPLVLAAQRSRRSEQDLIENTPADGLVGGTATIDAADAVVISYDYMVLAGTQGMRNHAKTDRLLDVAARKRIPVVLFAEGGGGRPGDTDAGGAAGLELNTFRAMAALHGRVPLVAVVSGRCFAGNAALAGVCDVLIATPEANIGMGGPAMVEGGGLGRHRPEEIGPLDVQRRNGVVHLVAEDDAHAVALARQYLSYFQAAVDDWQAPDERLARHAVPENRLRAYDARAVIESIVDVGSTLELRADYGMGVVTALVRVEGTAYGLLANSSKRLGGAIDAEAADKAADFLTLCQAHGLPLVSLCDTPGFMVGPDAETEGTVRRFGRLFVAGARLTVPFGMIILRKGYGLGAMAMAGGSFHAPEFTVAWPTGEIGPMGLEGAVRLGFRNELDAITDSLEREREFARYVEVAYQHGKALTAATTFELDDVIDPADTRRWIGRLRRV